MRRIRLACLMVVIMALTLRAPAEPPPSSQPASDMDTMLTEPGAGDTPTSSGTLDDQMLGGPEVELSAVTTLVKLDAGARFVRVEGRPEEAALALLELDGERRELARQAAAARRETLRVFLLDNLDLVVQNTDAIEAKDNKQSQKIQKQMYDRFDPAHLRDPLAAQFSAVLTADEHARLTELSEEYWQAWIDWELRNSKDKSDAARERVQARLLNDLFQQELRQAYERTLRPYRAKFEAIVRAVEPTDEQKAAIRVIMHDYIRAGGLNPTPEQQQEAARRIYQVLDEQQRAKMFEATFNRL